MAAAQHPSTLDTGAPARVTVTLPDDCKDLFAWLMRYEPRFKGNAAAVAAALISKGAEAMYAESLDGAEPLDAEAQASLDASQRAAFAAALDDEA